MWSELLCAAAQKRKEEAARKEREKIYSMLSRQLELHGQVPLPAVPVRVQGQYPCPYNVRVPWSVHPCEYKVSTLPVPLRVQGQYTPASTR